MHGAGSFGNCTRRNVKLLLARLSHLDVNEQQQREIDGLREENQTLRDCLKATEKRMIMTDAQRKKRYVVQTSVCVSARVAVLHDRKAG